MYVHLFRRIDGAEETVVHLYMQISSLLGGGGQQIKIPTLFSFPPFPQRGYRDNDEKTGGGRAREIDKR